jgi:hypothetical protein
MHQNNMNKYAVTFFYVLLLLCIEFILCVIFFEVYTISEYGLTGGLVRRAFKDAVEINLIRLLFYIPFLVFMMPSFFSSINIRNKMLRIAVINSGAYVLISLFYALIFPFAFDYFSRFFFYAVVGSALLSPYILNATVPFYRRWISSL